MLVKFGGYIDLNILAWKPLKVKMDILWDKYIK